MHVKYINKILIYSFARNILTIHRCLMMSHANVYTNSYFRTIDEI